ncbi:hypothetical protein OG948_23470 [Embleya sp. NBC_00888]|uniref:hypothetical protein n=1 Tax=Embleya sp. NBC_00888 TaxID=2975960 RepID=UPI0038646FDA|nr:hypothetical protein OG948_23470 [Embleya sp. NBC_00888]
MPQRPNRRSAPVVALLFVLSLVAAFGAGFARGEGAGGSLPVAAANVHATPVPGGSPGPERPQDCRPASATSALPAAGELDRPEADPYPHPDLATFVAAGACLPRPTPCRPSPGRAPIRPPAAARARLPHEHHRSAPGPDARPQALSG